MQKYWKVRATSPTLPLFRKLWKGLINELIIGQTDAPKL
jgi:hypothetical protein